MDETIKKSSLDPNEHKYHELQLVTQPGGQGEPV